MLGCRMCLRDWAELAGPGGCWHSDGNASNISHLSMFAVDIRKWKFLSNLNLLKLCSY